MDRAEIAVRALAARELQMHQPAGRIVNEDQQRAGITPVLKPTVVAAINLDQLSERFTTQPG